MTCFKKDSDVIMTSSGNLAFAKAKEGKKDKALQVSELYGDWKFSNSVDFHFSTTCYHEVFVIADRFAQIYKTMHKRQTEKYGSKSRQAVETIGLMSVLHIQQSQFEEASGCLSKVLEWQTKYLDPHHPALKNTKATIHKLRQAIHCADDSVSL